MKEWRNTAEWQAYEVIAQSYPEKRRAKCKSELMKLDTALCMALLRTSREELENEYAAAEVENETLKRYLSMISEGKVLAALWENCTPEQQKELEQEFARLARFLALYQFEALRKKTGDSSFILRQGDMSWTLSREGQQFKLQYRSASRFDNDFNITRYLPADYFDLHTVEDFCRYVNSIVPGAGQVDPTTVGISLRSHGWVKK